MTLTNNQARLLNTLGGAERPLTVKVLAERTRFTEDALRNSLARMEKRGFVAVAGSAGAKTFAPTHAGREALKEHGPVSLEPASGGDAGALGQDSNPDSSDRRYVVLEELSLDELVEEVLLASDLELTERDALELLKALKATKKKLYERVCSPEARNTEHALRQAAKEVYGAESDAEPSLVAIAARMFRVTPVRINTRQTVSVG